ncbi:PAS domain S-box protein [Methylomagnum sp.]
MIGFTSTTHLNHIHQAPQALRPYAAVLLATALVAVALFWLREAGHPTPDVPALLVPVLLGACLGGFPAGLFAMVLGLVVDGLLFRDFSFGLAALAQLGPRSPLVAYVAASLLMSLVGHWLRQADQRNRDVLEKQQSLEHEIARRRKLEEALVRSQRTVKAQLAEIEGIYATAPVGLALVDRELRFTRVNRQWSEISGLAPEAHVGRSIRESVPRLGEALAVFAGKVCLTGESIAEREIRGGLATDPDGERVWLASFVPLESERAGETGVTIAIRDITEQKRFEAALRESEEKYRQLTEWSPHCIWMTDPAGSLVYANRHWHEFTGLSLETAKGRGWLSMVHPDDRDRVGEQYLNALRDGAHLETELRLCSKRTGEYRWHIMGALPLRGRLGMLSSWLVVAMDVHQIKSAEQALRATEARLLLALEAGQMAVWEKGEASGNITWLDPKDLRSSMNLEGEMARWIETLYPASEAAPVESHHAEFRAMGGDGQPRWVEARAQRLTDAAGEYRLVGILADVTERKRVGEALQEADRRKDEFLAVLAHELRNPLAPILTSAQLLRRRGLERPDLMESATASIERQVKHLSRLIGDLSDISRIARGMIELKPEILNLDAVVSQAVEVCRPMMDKQRQELFLDLPEEPLHVQADPARLAQVIGNLLVNAAKFTPAGGNIHLTVGCDDSGRQAVISVRDEGVGIDPNKLEAIFDSFVQLERPQHPGHSGLGIGLALARRLMRMQGGEVSAYSAGPGKGSQFTIRLPLP